MIQIGSAKVDFDALQITGPAGDYSVEPKIMAVLQVLIDNAGEVVTRDALIDEVWGVGYGGDERLSRAISILRKSLGDTRGQHNYIQTIPKRGYKFIGESALTARLPAVEDPLYSSDHSEKTETRNKYRMALLSAMTAAMLVLAAGMNFSRQKSTTTAEPPLVIVMDSAHPARIYDEEVRNSGATNADILSDILADLPVRTQKELISPSWHRYEAITKFEPDLIVIHYSGFKQEDGSGDRPQLRLLMEYFQKSDTEFLVYSRASDAWLTNAMDKVMGNVYEDFPDLKTRVEIYPLLEYGEPHWKDPVSALGIKMMIKDMLELETH